MYFAFAQSILQYGIISWGTSYITYLNTLQRTQNILLRITLNKHRLYSTQKLYKETKFFKLTDLYFYKILYFVNKRDLVSSSLLTIQ